MKKLPLLLAVIGVACIACGFLWNIWAWFEHWDKILTPKEKFFVYLYPSILIAVGFCVLIAGEKSDDGI